MQHTSPSPDGVTAPARAPRGVGRRVAVIATAVAMVTSIAAISGAAVAKLAAAPHATPTVDIVGKGFFNCSNVTGEIGFSPTTISTGGPARGDRVSIWFQGTKCAPVAGAVATPVPISVVGSMSFLSTRGNYCPQLGVLSKSAVLNLAYNFPGVPVKMIDPSVAPQETVIGAANWQFPPGGTGVTDGSYVSPKFYAVFHPILIGPQSCAKGVTSMYIQHGVLYNV